MLTLELLPDALTLSAQAVRALGNAFELLALALALALALHKVSGDDLLMVGGNLINNINMNNKN